MLKEPVLSTETDEIPSDTMGSPRCNERSHWARKPPIGRELHDSAEASPLGASHSER